ncbi:hypothetical protein RBH20_17990 [Haloarcula sp. H-GB4]|uniref:hypothetical protein n=1 Tax=Haloarcula sp. H-GB4 TaxID=3069755 RepID=UPI0027B4C6BF|nr:hypothetical protein [Haloarcula sp. H-GB4]MDQ2074433.1 hypothetical protein [Haloarcula sp. H-GB4]
MATPAEGVDNSGEVSSTAGGESGGLGESISDMAPGSSEAGVAANATSAANGAADNAPDR